MLKVCCGSDGGIGSIGGDGGGGCGGNDGNDDDDDCKYMDKIDRNLNINFILKQLLNVLWAMWEVYWHIR